MRNTQLRPEEIAEMDATKQKETRAMGLDLMPVRDRGWGKLRNGTLVEWHTDRPLQELEARRYVPDGMVVIDNKLYDTEELRRFLRWA